MYVDINLALTWSPRDALSSQTGWLKISEDEYDGGDAWWMDMTNGDDEEEWLMVMMMKND